MLKHYLSLVKFSHTVFALPFAVIGFFTATWYHQYDYSWSLLGLVILCMIFARSAAMAFNRLIDRKIDERNQRTVNREIPAGILSKEAVSIFILINVCLFVLCTWLINPICFYLSPIALMVILGYSYTKRFTAFSHFILGLGISLAPIGAYLAVAAQFELLPLLFSVAVLFWVSGFDIIYALQDDEFDNREHLFSIPAWLGRKNALMLSSAVHVVSIGTLVLAGVISGFSIWYWIGTVLFATILLYQHTIIKATDLSRVTLAFFTMNGFASILFAGFVLLELYFH